jgi:hypothetical protein
VEHDLTQRNSVARIQAWLASRPMADRPATPESWPDCIQELKPKRVSLIDNGGISLMVMRGEHMTIAVYPPGRRPPLDVHEPSQARPGYVGAFGPDASIAFSEKWS